ncbi:hypothetical protein [Staphylococcus phage vB_SauH_DELF3]|nr:hypothetical protein [Staphylococcus phage vB_SauH_DELF3]
MEAWEQQPFADMHSEKRRICSCTFPTKEQLKQFATSRYNSELERPYFGGLVPWVKDPLVIMSFRNSRNPFSTTGKASLVKAVDPLASPH